jgi:FKBP-type peptidyl-prolyl cis-trans isomerase FklB
MKLPSASPSLLLVLAALTFAGCGKQPASSSVAPSTPVASPAPATGAIESTDQKVCYGIGYSMGTRLAQDGAITVDQAALVAGILDGLAKTKTRVSEADLETAFTAIQQKMAAAAAAAGEKQLAAGNEYLEKNKAKAGVTVTASGLQYEVLVSGTGAKPKATDTVRVHYHGTLVDGTVFDSSVERGEPLEYPVSNFVPGWIEALQLMSVGDKWKLTLPPAIGYGARANGKIPANAVLVFDIELLGIK